MSSYTLHADFGYDGKLRKAQQLTFSDTIITSTFAENATEVSAGVHTKCETLRIEAGNIVVPGLIDLHTNGLCGIHFTTLTPSNHIELLTKVAREMAMNGVTAWYATIPTVRPDKWKELLTLLNPRTFANGSPLLGAHVEGPFLQPTKNGAHDQSYLLTPSSDPYQAIYGHSNLSNVIKMITLAPELPGALELITSLRESYPHIRISLGHSSATYSTGHSALQKGAISLTHTFNAMAPLHHREPGLLGLIGDSTYRPYFSIISDLIHVHPAAARFLFRADPTRCMLITDSIELAGLPDGIYPPNGQITYPQMKRGNRATNVVAEGSGETETLIGSCITLIEGVRNGVDEVGMGVAEAVRCASGNVADLMGDRERGELSVGRRADFVVLSKDLEVRQTWIGGRCVWYADDEGREK